MNSVTHSQFGCNCQNNALRTHMCEIDISIRNLLFPLVPTEQLNLTSQQLNMCWGKPERPNEILTITMHKNETVAGTTWKAETIFSTNVARKLINFISKLN